jgi:hypothetical protein
MEPTALPQGNKKNIIMIIIGIVILVLIAMWYFTPRTASFCFTFAQDTQFGDRVVENPSNSGIMGKNGTEYFPVEVRALQNALEKDGFYIDPYEKTGAEIYLTAFFGPTTVTAVKAFQKKHGLEESGQVDNGMIDKLNELYACPKSDKATTTPTTSTASTT